MYRAKLFKKYQLVFCLNFTQKMPQRQWFKSKYAFPTSDFSIMKDNYSVEQKGVLEISVWGAFFVYLRVNTFNSQGKSIKAHRGMGEIDCYVFNMMARQNLIFSFFNLSVIAL